MSAAIQPLGLPEFLAWERAQPARYEFDGTQPVAMTGGSVQHSRTGARLIVAIGRRLQPPCEIFQPDLKVLTANGTRARYPDATIACGGTDSNSDIVEPVVVFEVVSPSTTLIDSRVKALEYQQTESVLVYVMLEAARPVVTVMRRSRRWAVEPVAAMLDLPEVGVALPLDEIYRAASG